MSDDEVLAEIDRIYTEGEFSTLCDADMLAYINLASSMPDGANTIRLDRNSYEEWIADTICLIAEVRHLRDAVAKE